MNAEIQKKLVSLAEEDGLKIETANDKLVLFSANQHSEAPVAVIDLNQPQHDVIFTLLHEIGYFKLHFKNPRPLRMPWFINRPYENELLGETAYKTRRALRLKVSKERQADLWALCAYRLIGCPDDLKTFLKQHPEKLPLFLVAVAGHVKTRIEKFIRTLFHP
jgi:hypothetical protein